ncbi:putative phage tail assembly chaperone [Erwinia pyrifoliae]|uniref:Phage tail assembly chaperone n=1 Tax=Erwinia pyrifoliae TaxID=79967 RepID=A0ABY5XEB6_ERWPY|nr:putative phage tail assembly chaperone [Erwinia pyrifoliae]MCT2387300.1 putative phage tail assembly chaperone [Erwinia pyrifoliae]MCU8587100.1 putative phage tail assembly chaperone [Erwinia pyrifoliae]UWS30963.1 putative phage tail assembly chaperone [Erwinia pyrifoliae]UWS35239.1 putative phage tail assembly chaperone [Erwinia pyrifoliae]
MTANKIIITMTVAGVPLSFEPNRTAYNSLINEMTMTNKVAPMVTYLGRIIAPDSKTQLADLLDTYPGVEMQIVEKVNAIYSPQVEIEIKN